MGFFNTVLLMGNVARDAEKKETASGVVMTTAIAVQDRGQKNEQGKPTTAFYEIVVFGEGRCALFGRWARKGENVLVQGKLIQSRWKDRDGKSREQIKIMVDTFEFNFKVAPKEDRPFPRSLPATPSTKDDEAADAEAIGEGYDDMPTDVDFGNDIPF